jgi:magnesium transporter
MFFERNANDRAVKAMDTINEKTTHESLQQNLDQIHDLLEKQHLIEDLVHKQAQRQGELVESIVQRQHSVELKKRLGKLHIADIADLLEALPLDERQVIWSHLEQEKAAEVLMELSDPVLEQLIHATSHEALLAILNYLDADDLAYIAEAIPQQVLDERFKAFTSEDKDWLHSAMAYPEDTVGYLMSNEMVTARENETLTQVQARLREIQDLPSHTDKLFVVNNRRIVTGVLSLQAILMNDPGAFVIDVMAKEVVRFQPLDEAVNAASAFERYDLVSAPVVNERGKLVGRLTVDLVVEFIRDEGAEDVINMAGLAEEEDLFAPIINSAKNRGVWLTINLFTAFVAATVISFFENTIAQLVALAALMPIVASVGGNSGNQTTALIIRGMALGQISKENTFDLLRKEIGISLLNGVLLGALVGLFAFVFYRDLPLAVLIATAMMLTLIIAAVLGFSVPLLLKKIGRDPALGSSVLQTATTDSLAFLVFLGMATIFLL